MKKVLSPFAAYIDKYFQFGMLIDKFADEPGGIVGGDSGDGDGGAGSGGMGGSADGDSGGNNDSGDDSGDGNDGSESDSGDDGDNKDGNDGDDSDDNAIDYEKRFTDLDGKVANLINTLSRSNSDSGNDGDDSGKDAGGIDLEHDDLVAMMADDPADFISKLTATIEQSVTNKVALENADSAFNGKVEETIDAYAEANDDFEPMWDKGDLQKFMEKNPGHNAISAHMTMTMEQRIADAKKEGADEAIKNFRTKSNSQVLNGGPGIPPDQRDAALKNPEKFGGKAAVIAQRAGIQ
ncbi:MAG: hypothetical protein DRI71_11975 [Bacteroidetes bacterium]|nr:MAG: hypothetical protein DRI71_11975 [Bacteroidota bacterium]